MDSHIEESLYPLSFRKKDAKDLGEYLKNRKSVVLVGMKRVGISNFLRFFLYHEAIKKKYINDNKKHLFIPIDLNDLVERELYPFWVLTLKRIEDAVQSSDLSLEGKQYIDTLFLDSIQSKDLFLTIDCIRKSLLYLVEHKISPTIFFLRFDRMQDVVTPEFFANLQGLIDASHSNLSFVITSARSLESLAPEVFSRASISAFARTMYVAPGSSEDAQIIFDHTTKKNNMIFSPVSRKKILSIVDGYAQYLQFAISYLHEKKKSNIDEKLFDELIKDERIALQSEELWESLRPEEKEVLLAYFENGKVSEEEKNRGSYLWNTGMIQEGGKLFSPLFEEYVNQAVKIKKEPAQRKELSKKEHLLLTLLEENRGALCEREVIIQKVWPEVESYGVSDWAVDRLVARLRQKLKQTNSKFEIVTVKTRGYKLL